MLPLQRARVYCVYCLPGNNGGAIAAIHFESQELASRRQATVGQLTAHGLDGPLIFRQESMCYLTGYDTFGYCFF